MAKNLLKAGVELMVSDLNKEAVADVVAAGAEEGLRPDRRGAVIFIMVPSGVSPIHPL